MWDCGGQGGTGTGFVQVLPISFHHGSPFLYIIWWWTIGLLQATFQRHSLTPFTWTVWTLPSRGFRKLQIFIAMISSEDNTKQMHDPLLNKSWCRVENLAYSSDKVVSKTNIWPSHSFCFFKNFQIFITLVHMDSPLVLPVLKQCATFVISILVYAFSQRLLKNVSCIILLLLPYANAYFGRTLE
jgi:hypothetical protein